MADSSHSTPKIAHVKPSKVSLRFIFAPACSNLLILD